MPCSIVRLFHCVHTAIKSFIAVAAGIFLIVFGLNMLNVLPSVRVKVPRLNKALVVWRRKFAGNPTMVGLLNGLMIACGPLQAVYILAAGTGSMIEGANLLFMFGLGTLPVMLGFGALASKLGTVMKHIIKRRCHHCNFRYYHVAPRHDT